MSLLRRVGNSLVRMGSWLSRADLPGADAGWVGDIGTGRKRSPRGWLQTFEESARLHSVVECIAEDVACNPWHVYRKEPDGKLREIFEGHALVDWMAAPWKTLSGGSWFALLYLTQVWLDMCGEAFWIVIERNGVPYEVWPIPPHWVHSMPYDGRKGFYGVVIAGQEIPEWIPARNMCWFRRPSVVDPFKRGVGRAQAVDDEVTGDDLASKYSNSYFRNGARPDLVVFLEGLEDNPAQVGKLREQWEKRHRGSFNAGRPAFLPAKGRLEQVVQNFKEMAFVELRNQHRDVIWQNFRISPEIMGAVENSNRATAEAAMFLYQSNVVLRRLQFLALEMARFFVPKFRDPRLVLTYENPVKESNEFKLAQGTEMWREGAISRDEYRQTQGKDPIGGLLGQAYSVPLNRVELMPDGSYRVPPKPSDSSAAEKPAPQPKPSKNGRIQNAELVSR